MPHVKKNAHNLIIPAHRKQELTQCIGEKAKAMSFFSLLNLTKSYLQSWESLIWRGWRRKMKLCVRVCVCGIPRPLRDVCFRERPQTARGPTVWETSQWTGPDRCYERVVLSAFFRILNQHPNWQKNELSLTLCRPIGDLLCYFPWSGNHYTWRSIGSRAGI